jgi:hypothetical protein
MTTLIIHPNLDIQKTHTYKIVEKQLGEKIQDFKSHPDIQILDGSQVSSIGIDDIREFKKKLQFQPYQSTKQVGIIFQAAGLTTEAQNALLKILEEPGQNTIFILTVGHEKSLLPTILSRSRKRYIDQDLEDSCETSFQDVDDELLRNLTTKVFFSKPIEERFIIIDELVKQNKQNPKLIEWFLKHILQTYRAKLINDLKKDEPKTASTQKSIKHINQAFHYLSCNVNKRIALENLILQLEESIM